eukprot:gi/632943018/ref/XP_007886733.1/ PREDICTED: coiled-coil domain-containing protein 57 isoform X2 [Callorhinchus milii]
MEAQQQNDKPFYIRYPHVRSLGMLQEDGNFDELLARKEQEWKELQTRRFQLLETTLRDVKTQLKEQQEKFTLLKEDFKYNLKVLDERDRELERYDSMFSHLKVVESSKQAEISELRIRIDKMQEAVNMEAKTQEQLELRYQQQLKQHQLDLEKTRSSKHSETNRHREEYEKLKRELERKIREVEGELSLQKQELLAEFDAEMRQREHEFTLRADEMSNVVLTNELKVKLLSKELEVLREVGAKAAESLQVAENTNHEMEKQLQRKEWDLKDVTTLKEVRIKELEDKIRGKEMKWNKEVEMFQRKFAELDRFARERDAILEAAKEANAEQIRELENKGRELQISLESLEMEKRQGEWRCADGMREKEDAIEKLRGELSTVKAGWDAHIQQISKETVAKDVQVKTLQDQDSKLRAELTRHKEDGEKYKQQLVRAVEREKNLEQARVQVELDWQYRCEEMERNQYLKSEELIQGLSQAQNQALAELQETKRELQEMEALVQTVTLERDRAVATLQKHGILPESDLQASVPGGGGRDGMDFPSDAFRKLQQQNLNLRIVIGQMRKEMETLSEHIPANQSKDKLHDNARSMKNSKEALQNGPLTSYTPEYVKSLEVEVGGLKHKCRKLEEQLEDISKASNKTRVPLPGLPISADNAYLQNHIRTLNETIGGLRAEKVSAAATIKKHEARIVHLDSAVTQLTQQVRQKQVEINQLQYEITSHTQRSNAEIMRLKERVAELELQLSETRREADEYFRGNLQQNLETVALGNEVSALKLDLLSGRAPVVVEQNAFIRELQEETLRLRQQVSNSASVSGPLKQSSSSASVLQAKLKQAARHISRLAREKQQLIEMGNRLRAELLRSGLDVSQPSMALNQSVLPSQSPKQLAQRRLSALEHLQYQLTTQELEYAQRQQFKQVVTTARRSSPESEINHNPWENNTAGVGCTTNGNLSAALTGKPVTSITEESALLATSQPQNLLMPEPSGLQPVISPLMSSYGTDSSIQDIWQMLERGSSPSIGSPQDNTVQAGGGLKRPETNRESVPSIKPNSSTKVTGREPTLNVKGIQADIKSRTKAKHLAETPKKPKRLTKAAKIRNYNIRD